MTMNNVVKDGYTFYTKPGGKKPQKKYAVLHKRLQNGKPTRLELFDSKEIYERNGKKQTISLENASPLETEINTLMIKIHIDGKVQTFTFDNGDDYQSWLNDLNFTLFGHSPETEYCSLYDDDQLYDVVIHDTDVTQRLKLRGSYFLYVSTEEVELLDKQTKKSVIKWPLYQLRKYGRDKQEFSLEAGRRCPSGQGMFTFTTDQYNSIFREVENNVKALATRGRAASTSSTNSYIHPKPSFPMAPSSPRVPTPAVSLYDDPIDVRKESNKGATADDTYTYNEPLDTQTMPKVKPQVSSKPPKDKKTKGAKFVPKSKEGPKKPPRKVEKPSPSMVNDVTYAEATCMGAQNSSAAEYSHLNLAPTVNDTEYDSISYPDKRMGNQATADSTYATTGDFSGSYSGNNPQQDSVYDHVQR
uniref:Docking protein 5 n=1 Tax=Ciona intestinalis TaxID=7719 RepID=H2XK86_CIOIN|nr:docking protein 5 [Ciona intestinalis]|eukprot:XP_002130339.1 docking protein 5 [Ciona intestinalis]